MNHMVIEGKHGTLAPQVHRRLAAVAGGGLALGFNVPFGARPPRSAQAPATEVNAWVVDQARRHLRDPHRALGDGSGHAHRSRPARRRRARVRLEEGDDRSITPGQNLARKRVWGEMGTGGSRGIRTSEDYVRRGGAAARMMLLQAAAERMEGAGRRAHRLRRRHHACGVEAPTRYGKVAAAAAKLTPPDPKSIKLKDPKDWKIAGKPLKRLDTADKLDGSKVYAIDVKLPGMLCAAIKAMPGVRRQARELSTRARSPACRACKRVVRVNDTAVAVVADTWWHAKKALDALPIVWDEGESGIAVERDDRRACSRKASTRRPAHARSARTAMR